MEIGRGKYQLGGRNLNFDVVDALEFNSSSCFYFRGDNGYGKTSFLEKIVIPAFEANDLPYLYIGQDIRTQLYTLRALLSVQGFKVSDTDELELLRLWIDQNQSAGVLMLDEFDKYFPDYGFIFEWSPARIRTYIIVTHQGYQSTSAVAENRRIYNVKFELVNIEGRLKNVRVRHE